MCAARIRKKRRVAPPGITEKAVGRGENLALHGQRARSIVRVGKSGEARRSEARPLQFRRLSELHGAEEAGTFFDEEELIGSEILKGFEEAGGPADFEESDLFGLSQAEVNA